MMFLFWSNKPVARRLTLWKARLLALLQCQRPWLAGFTRAVATHAIGMIDPAQGV
jgi:hypothetical protein